MMLDIPLRRAAALVLVTTIAMFTLPGVVAAHAELKTASPAAKSTATDPVTVVSGIYTEAMTPAGSSIIVKDASGAKVAEGTVDPAQDTRMMAIPATPLGTGTYLVEWTSVALDGHLERGTWAFKVAVAATPSPSPSPTVTPAASPTAAPSTAPSAGPTATPTAVPATPVPSAAPTPVPSADTGSTGSGGDVVLPIILALIVLGGGAAYLLSRRDPRPTDPT